MLKGGGSGRTESAGRIEVDGGLVVGMLFVELEECLVEVEAGAEAEAALVEEDVTLGRPAMEAYILDA